ncbi:MAG TPA: peptide transporter [Phycisphaerae bacterium]|nr:peptide transporter [Phycisphaerae bacterium]
MSEPVKKTLSEKELDLYRNILVSPTEFENGFGWSTVLGIVFCGLVMLPGSIYLGLMNGGRLGPAAAWVTVILFNEIARRALKTMKKQQLVVLLHAASVVMAANVLFPGGPCAQLVFRAYLAGSEAIRNVPGMREAIPEWWTPKSDSPAITERNLLHSAWLIPISLLAFSVFIGLVRRYTLGYFFFRLTSDVENLPFPMASVNAQGAMAMAEADESSTEDGEDPGKAFFDKQHKDTGKKKSERWRFFSLGAVMGIAFGMIQIGIPAITKVLLDKPIFLIPLPWVDTTVMTESILPATPTGIALDLGIILLGMVLPFWAVMGTAFAVLLKIAMNPILYKMDILKKWRPGQDTINTTFNNEVDFWMSFMMGASLGLLVVSIFQSIRDARKKMKVIREQKKTSEKRLSPWAPPHPGRGDYPMWIAGAIYTATSILMVFVCYLLLKDAKWMSPAILLNLLIFMGVYTMVYNPLISYLNARLLGIAGQRINIPYVKEAAFVLSGARGIDIWMMPIPWANYGHQAQAFRTVELTGTRFWSLVKTELVAIPLLFILSFAFWAFIWKGNEIPSSAFPYAQRVWEIQAKRTALQWSATHSPDGEDVDLWETEFGKAIHPKVVTAGFLTTTGIFALVAVLGLPAMFCYGMIKGFGQFPHVLVLEIVGALIARFILRKKYGAQRVMRTMPTLVAGYYTGVGLIAMATIALDLIVKAVSAAPF